jgi:Ca2+-binding EF-hand superfamily protein
MNRLTDQLLLETYYKALQLNLSEDFIQLLIHEMKVRKLNLHQFPVSTYN